MENKYVELVRSSKLAGNIAFKDNLVYVFDSQCNILEIGDFLYCAIEENSNGLIFHKWGLELSRGKLKVLSKVAEKLYFVKIKPVEEMDLKLFEYIKERSGCDIQLMGLFSENCKIEVI